jgi:uncharacterized protein (DUF2252 family)
MVTSSLTSSVPRQAHPPSGARPSAGAPATSPPPTPAERAEHGRAVRRALPLEAHAELRLDTRGDPVAVLEDQARTRLTELLPLRYGRMSADPFAFFRGSAAVMAADLAAAPPSGLYAQLCGDAHLTNFGVYASPERRLVFDVNDVDETAPGPFEWDVKRLAASIALVGRMNGLRGKERRHAVRTAVAHYRTTMRALAELDELQVWYARVEVEQVLDALRGDMDERARRRSRAMADKALRRDNAGALRALTTRVGGEVRFASRPPLLVPLQELPGADAQQVEAAVLQLLDAYGQSLQSDRRHLLHQFRVVDVARKVVGVGSVGTRTYAVLLLARDRDPLVLQVKEAGASVLEPYVDPLPPMSAGERVVTGQRLVQTVSDVFLGWSRAGTAGGGEHDFVVRQLRDGKGGVDPLGMRPRQLSLYARLCAWTLARAHARSGDRIAIAAYLGKTDAFERALTEFGETYAARAVADHALLLDAIGAGRLPVSGIAC